MYTPDSVQSSPITLSATVESQVYSLFAVAVALTGVGVFVGLLYLDALFPLQIVLLFAELAIIFTAPWWAKSSPLNYLMFGLFPLFSGITIAPFLLYVTTEYANGFSILLNALASTALMAGAAAVFARTTQWNLGFMGRFLFLGIIGLLVMGLLQIFFPSLRGGQMEIWLSGAGVVLFSLFIAYDIQRIQHLSRLGTSPFLLALSLYLDIYNLFLYVVRFMLAISGRRD